MRFCLSRRRAATVLARASEAMRAVAADPAVRDRFLRAGAQAVSSTPEVAWKRARSERPMWQEMVRIAGARME